MPQTKIEGKFYPLTSEVAKKLIDAKLTAGEWRLWSYLVSLDPWGDRYEDLPSTLTIMEEVDIKKSTFYAAIAKFQKHELFDFQDKGFAFRNLRGIPKIRKVVRDFGNDSENSESCPKIRKVVRDFGNNSEISENQQLEPSQPEDSSEPQTFSNSSQTDQTLSDERVPKIKKNWEEELTPDEKLNFRPFCKSESERLPKAPVLLDSWIAANFNELIGLYRERYGKDRFSAAAAAPLVQNYHKPKVKEDEEFYSKVAESLTPKLHPAIEDGLEKGLIKKLDPAYKGVWTAEGSWMSEQQWIDEYQNPDAVEPQDESSEGKLSDDELPY
jgi:hypothetical protein